MSRRSFVHKLAHASRAGTILTLELAMLGYGGTDKRVHGYAPLYSDHLGPLRLRRNRVLEIGVGGYETETPGGSLRVWRDYFCRSRIVGFDIYEKVVDLGARVKFVRGDQSAPLDLDRAVEELGGPPNIVIDDGSHYTEHAIASFEHLFPQMPAGSIYAVEDTHTSYWTDYGGRIPAPDATAIGLAKSLVDDVQVQDRTYALWPQWGPKPSPRVEDVAALHVYPGIFFVRKSG